MAEAFEVWQAKLDQAGGDANQALKGLGVDPGRAELLARARAEHRSADPEAQLEHAFCWISGVGMGSIDGNPGDLSDALSSILQAIDEQGVGSLASSLGSDLSRISEQAMSCALASGGMVPPGEKAASCAEGMLTGMMASKPAEVAGKKRER